MSASASTRIAALGEIAEIDRHGIDPSLIVAGTLFVGLENITGEGGFDGVSPVAAGELASTKFKFSPKHILYGKLRPYLRKIARPQFSGICSTDILPILPGPEVDRSYLAHFLRTDSMVRLAESRSSGANLPRLSPSALAEFEIPLPPLPEQRRVADILDKAEALRAKRREAIAGIDGLMKALFLDKFGNPVTNPKDWKVRKLIEVSDFENGDRSSNYPSGDQIKEEGVLFLSTKNIVDNKLDLSSAVFITEEKFRSLSRGKARRHDLIITLRGTLGSCCVFDCEHERAFINAQMMIIRPQEAVLYKYLHALITLPQAKAHFMRIGFGAAVQQLTASQLAELVIPVPPLELQQKFAQEITAAEEMRRKLENSATEIADLFAAVQHRAFRGEL